MYRTITKSVVFFVAFMYLMQSSFVYAQEVVEVPQEESKEEVPAFNDAHLDSTSNVDQDTESADASENIEVTEQPSLPSEDLESNESTSEEPPEVKNLSEQSVDEELETLSTTTVALTLVSEKVSFTMSEGIELTLEAPEPFPIETGTENEKTFIDTILTATGNAIEAVTDTIVDTVTSVVDAVQGLFSSDVETLHEETIPEPFENKSDDEAEENAVSPAEEVSPQESEDGAAPNEEGSIPVSRLLIPYAFAEETDIEKVPVSEIPTEEVESSSPYEEETITQEEVEEEEDIPTTTSTEEHVVNHDQSQEAGLVQTSVVPVSTTTATSTEEVVGIAWSGDVSIDATYTFVSDRSFVLTLIPHQLSPGVHTIHVRVPIGGSLYAWTGTIIWGGEEVREIVVNPEVSLFVVGTDMDPADDETAFFSTLWVRMKEETAYAYKMIAEHGTFSTTTSASIIDDTILVQSSDIKSILAYSLLGNTMSAYTVLGQHEPLLIHESPYRVELHDTEIEVEPYVLDSKGDTLYAF